MAIISGQITDGNDNIILDDAGDTLDALTGNDTILGGDGTDSLIGSSGNDSLDGGGGLSNTLDGGSEDDTLIGSGDTNLLQGGVGNDSLVGGEGSDILFGSSGNDTLIAGGGADGLVVGDVGDDYFFDEDIESGENNLGGDGNDTIDYSNAPLGLISEIDLEDGIATDSAGVAETILDFENVEGSQGGDTINGSNDPNRLNGNGGIDEIAGEGGKDTLTGGAGIDILSGGSGDDLLIGGADADILTGGTEDDSFRFNNANQGIDNIIDFGNGNDSISVSRSGFGGGIRGRGLLNLGPLDPIQFNSGIGATADNSSHRFIYDEGDGTLYFDIDGLGGAQQVPFATFATTPTLTANDIMVVF